MTGKLKISDALSFPLDAVTQTFGVLAKRRAGKSYLAARFVEELWAAKQQVVMLDPKGDSWGLRSSADGKAEGIPILILGGEHGDVRLEPSSGEIVARMIVEERVSAILDYSEFRKHEVATFSTAFLETLYRTKAKEQFRTAMMLVVDEADAIAPQRPQRGEERMLGAIEDVVRRGGQRGIGCFMATQRAAVINKNILTQVQILVALRTIAPQDLAAMEAWIDVHGTPGQREELMASLPSLPTGTAWFWSPGWPTEKGIFACVKVSPRVTFDSGATPKPGETKVAPKTVADVDLGAVQKRMAATIEKAKADDPKELRKRIVELERQVKIGAATKVETKTERVEVPMFDRDSFDALKREIVSQFTLARSNTEGLLHVYMSKTLEKNGATSGWAGTPRKTQGPGNQHEPRVMSRVAPERQGKSGAINVAAVSLGRGERAVLTAIAQYPDGATREQVTILTGYKRSTRDAYIQRLSQAGYVNADGDPVATAEGVAALGHDFEPLPTGSALREHWLTRLPEGERKVFEILIGAFPDRVERDAIGEVTGYKRSTRDAYIQRLAVRKLIDARGAPRASEELFL